MSTRLLGSAAEIARQAGGFTDADRSSMLNRAVDNATRRQTSSRAEYQHLLAARRHIRRLFGAVGPAEMDVHGCQRL